MSELPRQAAVATSMMALMLQPGCGSAREPAVADEQKSSNEVVLATRPERDRCPYLPSFVRLQEWIRRMEPAAALPVLYAYNADPGNENPEACQSIALDGEIATRERMAITLRLADGRSIAAQASYRCDVIVRDTTACNGRVEDATARPFSAGVEPIALRGATHATLRSELPDATLQGLYRLRVADLLDGGRATRLPTGTVVALTPGDGLMAAVAIYAASPPGRYRKFVWYYK